MGKRKRSGSWSKVDECGAKKSDDCDSQEEMEVDPLTPKASTINVRYSARVQEKQEKLRREASPSKQCVGEIICTTAVGSSTNGACKGKTLSTDDVVSVLPEPVPCGSTVHDGGLDGKRKKRTWELWSQYDKQLFFEALNEFGKDFDAIQTHLASKLKSKTKAVEPTQIKKKEQVRHFYYRTWNKIQKYLHFPKDMKKAFQELYGLVNYGELRKKQRALNGKTAAKLLELVEKGSTTIKVKGKTLRIKTPVCQALKKINNLTDVEPTKVPSKVVVELLPKDGAAWSMVQSLSHNPRIRSLVLLQRTLASIITYLEDRWKTSSDRIKEQMMAAFGKSSTRRLRLIPASKRDSTVPIFKAYETASSAKISLNAFSRNVLNKNMEDGYVKLVEKRKRKKSGSVGVVEGATDSVAEVDWSDAEIYTETKDIGAAGTYSSLATQLFRNAFGDNTLEVKGMSDEEVQRMLQSIYDLPRMNSQEEDDFENGDTDNFPDSDEYQMSARGNGNCCCLPSEEKAAEPEEVFSTSIEDEILKRGWTAEEAGSLTVGEVYMLVGNDEKLSFEYEWVEGDETNEANTRTRVMLERLIAVARNLKKKKQSRHKVGTGLGTTTCPCCGHNIVGSATTPANSTPSSVPSSEPVSNIPLGNNTVPSANPSNRSSFSSHISGSKNTAQSSIPMHHQPPTLSPSTACTVPTIFDTFDNAASSSGTAILSSLCNVSPNLTGPPEPELGLKMKKITPTMVSPSCTGAILGSAPVKTDLIEIPLSSTTNPKECKPEETFRVPPAGGINGTSPIIYPRIRPMPSSTNDNEESTRNLKNAPKPFLDLPKGNRRLGRPCCKKNIVPRYLPLLPKKVETPAPPAVWEIVANKPAVHTVYVSSAAQLMLPVTGLGLKASATGNSTLVTSSSGSEKEESRAPVLDPSKPDSRSNNPTIPVPPPAETPMKLGESPGNLLDESASSDMNCRNFKDLLQVSGLEVEKTDSNLSLSSFMDISLPESTRNVANECLKSEKFLDVTLGSTSCSLSLSNFLGQNDSSSQNLESVPGTLREESLKTPQKVIPLQLYRNQSPPSNLLSTENQWLTSDGNDLSLGSLLGNLEPAPAVNPENEMNFQSMIEDSNNHLDFTSKFSELVAELENTSDVSTKK